MGRLLYGNRFYFMRKVIFLLVALVGIVGGIRPFIHPNTVISQPLGLPTPILKWHPLALDFSGTFANETDDSPNPFLDYRLQVTFTGPSNQTYNVPGFFAGNGDGNGSGAIWRVIFAPDETGEWQYTASFRSGTEVAVSLEPLAGTPTSFDGSSGNFTVTAPNCADDGFLGWGRLEYVNGHYFKFREGGHWLKGGTNSPENFLAYEGFDNTWDQGGSIIGFLHRYTPHVPHWQPGDPNFVSADTGVDGKGIIGALNYLSSKNVNSIYFLPMNLGGDGQEVYPFVEPENTHYNKTHYDISKLHQWGIVLDHAQRKNIALHFVLAETEPENELWLDNGGLGVERKLFFRELIARYGHLLVAQWNLSEENDYPVVLLQEFAGYIQALDWANHPIAVHTNTDYFGQYKALLGDGRFTSTSIQYTTQYAGAHPEAWRIQSTAAGQPWILNMDENTQALVTTNEPELRKNILYPVYFSGGNIEWYAGYSLNPPDGDLLMEDFSKRQQMWDYTWYARKFMTENLPFWQMEPADELLVNESSEGEVFAQVGQVYALYLPKANSTGQLDLQNVSGTFTMRWYDPRTGEFVGGTRTVTGGGFVNLGQVPHSSAEDWVMLVEKAPQVNSHNMAGGFANFLPLVTKACP
jgi:hypothetical protein